MTLVTMKYGIGNAVVIEEIDFVVALEVVDFVIVEANDFVVTVDVLCFVVVTVDVLCFVVVALASDAIANALIVTQSTILTGG